MKISHQNGFSLTELLIVIVIMGTLATIAGIIANSMLQRYAIEGQIRELYADLMNVRARSMQKNRMHFVYLLGSAFSVYEDTNTPPDGNETPEAADSPLLQKTLKRAMTVLKPRTPFDPDPSIVFDSKGMTTDIQTICMNSDVSPAFDCIIISPTRINTGKIVNQGGACVATNCTAK
ncbi:MAG: pilus assembly FimT family protein [Nitrospirota bacterium]